MRLIFPSCLLVLLTFFISTSADAQSVVECPASQLDVSKVDFTASDCKTTPMQSYSMTDKSVWILISDPVIHNIQNSPEPMGLFISGWVSAKVYVNGVKIGENGTSALHHDTEIPGTYDWVGYVPQTALKESSNQVVMHLSSFHTHRTNFHPFNSVYIDVYQDPSNMHLQYYWPTLIPLGALLLSLIYLLRRLSLEPKTTSLLCLLTLTLTATLQLIVEISRGFYAYAYPLHDIRLLTILLLAFLFGQALLIQSLTQFTHMKKRVPLAIGLGIILTLQFLITDPDLKATSVILVPAALAIFLVAFERYRSKKHQYTPCIILFAFAALIVFTPHNFLDVYLYYCMAGLLAYLFSHEARNRVNQQKELVLEKQRAEQLQLVLDMNTKQGTDHTIALKDAGKVTILKIENILFCKGAGDYVEVYLADKTSLHSGSLSNIADELPSYFIKVHRSYLVNAKHIDFMRRLASGTGEIELSNGMVIPVSRRLLPKLKETLARE